NIFAGRGPFMKFFCFEIEMFVAPWCDGLTQCASEFLKIGKCSRAFIVFVANRALDQVAMAVSVWIVALAEELCVLDIGKRRNMQTVRGTERFANAQKHLASFPGFREKIIAFMQTNTRRCRFAPEDETSYRFRRHRFAVQSVDVPVQIFVIELASQRSN